MWAVVKGTLLGLWLVGFGTIAWLYFSIFRRLPPGPGEVGVTVFTAYTIQNPVWWTGVVVCLVLGFVIVRSWSVPRALWITLAVTGLVPVGCLTLFFVLVYKLKQASQGHL